ncbi:hypothetical protein LZ32DRAFT_302515 [Colletotrichum eremochloae]|nr:hypothetical protein LZ32DRAFT_302515 [Colletotrichum eremochloae]
MRSRISNAFPSQSRVDDREGGKPCPPCVRVLFSCTPGTPPARPPYITRKFKSVHAHKSYRFRLVAFVPVSKGRSPALPAATLELQYPFTPEPRAGRHPMSTCVVPPRPSFRLFRCKFYHTNPFSLLEVRECCHVPRLNL